MQIKLYVKLNFMYKIYKQEAVANIFLTSLATPL